MLSLKGGSRYYVLSDIHLTGRDQQLCNTSVSFFVDFLKEKNQPSEENSSQTLVFNGDFFDFYSIASRISPAITVGSQLIEIKEANPDVFRELSIWLARGNCLVFVLGNHDYPISSQRARKLIKEVFFSRESWGNILFDEAVTINERVYVEHGHRFEPLYRERPNKLMKYVRRNLRKQLFNILRRYPYMYNNRNFEDNIFLLLIFIDPWLYFWLGLKSFLPFLVFGFSKIFWKKNNCGKIEPSDAEMDVHFPVVSDSFAGTEFARSNFFKRGHKMRLAIIARMIGHIKRNKNGALRRSEKKMLSEAHHKLRGDLSMIRCFIVGHFHVCFEYRIKETGQKIFGLGTWLNWIPFLQMIDHNNPHMINYWLHTLPVNRENAFTRASRQFPYIEISKESAVLRDWSQPGVVLGSSALNDRERS